MNYELIILDLDGTMVKLPIDYGKMRNELYNLFSGYGFREEFRPIHLTIKKLCKKIETDLGKEEAEKACDSALKIIEDLEVKAAKECIVLEGATDFLENAKEKKLAIVSSNSKKCIETAIKSGLWHHEKRFDVIIGYEDVENLKPSPDGILIVLEKTGADRKNVIMLGDSVYDAIAAKRAGIMFGGVLTGAATKEDFKREGVNLIASNLKGYAEVLL